jgi:RNA polymerase primary sigma factor
MPARSGDGGFPQDCGGRTPDHRTKVSIGVGQLGEAAFQGLAASRPETLCNFENRHTDCPARKDGTTMMKNPNHTRKASPSGRSQPREHAALRRAARNTLPTAPQKFGTFTVAAESLGEPVLTTEDLSRKFNVSTKTVDRWRTRGLVGKRMVVGNRQRIGFLQSEVERFVADHAAEVERGSRFSQLSVGEKSAIVGEARRLSRDGASPADVAKSLSDSTGRSVEAIRQTLRNHDRHHPHDAVFPHAFVSTTDELKHDLYRSHRRGASVESLAREYGRSRSAVERLIAQARAEAVFAEPIEYVYNGEFETKGIEDKILGPAPESSTRSRAMKAPAGLPPYLASLYSVPLLSGPQEQYHFRRMNFLKWKAGQLRDRLDPESATSAQIDRIEGLLEQAGETKDLLIRSNLRLVVSIAKRNIRSGHDFFEMVSDGNMSLIRAIEKFDYSKGFKLSTYATWAIKRNFARSIPAEHTRSDRFRTGTDELFQHSEDDGANPYEQQIVHRQQHDALRAILKQLQDRERDILVCRYGLNEGTEPLTLEEVGARFGVTKERIRQLETRALGKLREIATTEKLDIPGI